VGYRLDSFWRVRKIAKSFVLSVRPFEWNNSAPTGGIFIKFDLLFFRNSVEKIQLSFSFDKNNVYFTRRHMYVMIISPLNSENGKWCRHKLQRKSKHILCSVTLFSLNSYRL